MHISSLKVKLLTSSWISFSFILSIQISEITSESIMKRSHEQEQPTERGLICYCLDHVVIVHDDSQGIILLNSNNNHSFTPTFVSLLHSRKMTQIRPKTNHYAHNEILSSLLQNSAMFAFNFFMTITTYLFEQPKCESAQELCWIKHWT